MRMNLAQHIRDPKEYGIPFICINQRGIVPTRLVFSKHDFAGEKGKEELRYVSEVTVSKYKDPVMAKNCKQ